MSMPQFFRPLPLFLSFLFLSSSSLFFGVMVETVQRMVVAKTTSSDGSSLLFSSPPPSLAFLEAEGRERKISDALFKLR